MIIRFFCWDPLHPKTNQKLKIEYSTFLYKHLLTICHHELWITIEFNVHNRNFVSNFYSKMESHNYEHYRNLTLMFFFEKLLEKGGKWENPFRLFWFKFCAELRWCSVKFSSFWYSRCFNSFKLYLNIFSWGQKYWKYYNCFNVRNTNKE